ncbi:MAG: tRNA (adenosine(37)-N6)-dimethylallyltransferase MiaA [Balneolaceae bacterium]|nr:tRNA (adenosine(37)-N6)-dimethylallyltransferase MiaA [Balneolaceae bacterium]
MKTLPDIMLLGPTAVGKSSVALELAELLGGEIISADSRQCYREVNIGTATPSAGERERVPHHNIGILDPKERDSAADFCERARAWAEGIRARARKVLYVGGSTLHLQCLLQPFDEVPEADEENRDALEKRLEREGVEPLYGELREVDPDYARQMDGMNPQRIVRALDVWMQTGRPFSSFHTGGEVQPPDHIAVFGLRREREELYRRINLRAKRMAEEGLVEEVERLLEAGYTTDDPGLNTVGYREPAAFLRGEISREEMVRRIQARTRRYAKRQLTWFRRWDFIRWVDADGQSPAEITRTIADKRLAAKSNKD